MTRRFLTAAAHRAIADELGGIETTMRRMSAESAATQIAAEIGWSVSRTIRHMRALGLPIGPRLGTPILDYNKVRAALESGMTCSAVAAEFGVTRQAISHIAGRHGFPISAMRRHAPLRRKHA